MKIIQLNTQMKMIKKIHLKEIKDWKERRVRPERLERPERWSRKKSIFIM
jgi:hypothetical protein